MSACAVGVIRLPSSLSWCTCLKSIWWGGKPTVKSISVCSSSPHAITSSESAFRLYPAAVMAICTSCIMFIASISVSASNMILSAYTT